MTKQDLSNLIELAKDWREFSKDSNGWNSETYEKSGLSVWCYFSVKSDHTLVKFGGLLHVNFFNPINVAGLTLDNIDTIKKLVKEYREYLEELKGLYSMKDKETIRLETEKKMKVLEDEKNRLLGVMELLTKEV